MIDNGLRGIIATYRESSLLQQAYEDDLNSVKNTLDMMLIRSDIGGVRSKMIR